MSDTNYIILKNNHLSKDNVIPITSKLLDDSYKGSISEFAKKDLASDNGELEAGDVIYEIKPVYRVHLQITVSKVKSL